MAEVTERLGWPFFMSPEDGRHLRFTTGTTARGTTVGKNLKPATRRQNAACHRGWSNKPSGPPIGVTRHGKRFRALIEKDGKQHYLGGYATPGAAARAYQRVAREM
jgi:hypothetical protein